MDSVAPPPLPHPSPQPFSLAAPSWTTIDYTPVANSCSSSTKTAESAFPAENQRSRLPEPFKALANIADRVKYSSDDIRYEHTKCRLRCRSVAERAMSANASTVLHTCRPCVYNLNNESYSSHNVRCSNRMLFSISCMHKKNA